MKALDDAEARLGCKLPKRFRETYSTRRVLTECPGWEIYEPSAFRRTYGVPIDTVVIGKGAEGFLFMRLRNGVLGDSLWIWESEKTKPTRVARSLVELVDGRKNDLEEEANRLLESDSSRASFGHETTAAEITCPFCGTLDQITVDPSGGTQQTFIEDCANCCHPRTVHVEPDADGVRVWVER